MGTTGGGMRSGELYHRAVLASDRHAVHPSALMQYVPQRQLLDLQTAFGYGGPLLVFANACASSANALGYAFQQVRSGQADRVLTGGYDALAELIFVGFNSLQASTPERCRPFDKNRSGLAIGEGAGVLLLESFSSARARGADILAEIVGYGQSVDTNHMTQPHPDGDGAIRAMNEALADAQLLPDKIDYINAHGTATPQNDRMESKAIRRIFGDRPIPVSSTKGAVGHALGAAGGLEAAFCVLALQHQMLPPNVGYETPDPDCELAIVRQATPHKVRAVLSNNFGFGGLNASLIFCAP
jgi:3-oxoacyl-[acyl-carrier-protein] synthase II